MVDASVGAYSPGARMCQSCCLSHAWGYSSGPISMTVFNAEVGYAASLASYNKALAEIEFLTGKQL